MSEKIDSDWMIFENAKVELSDIPGIMPSSLDDLDVSKLPIAPLDDPSETPPAPARGGRMHWSVAVLWCLLIMLIVHILVPIAFMCGLALVHFKELQTAAQISNNDAQVVINKLLNIFLLPENLMAETVCSHLVIISFSLFLLRWKLGSEWRRLISLRLPTLDHVVLSVVAIPALLLLVASLEPIISRLVPSFGIEEMTKVTQSIASFPWFIAVGVIALGPCIGEELWCRGFLGRGLVGRYGYALGVLFTSILFGLIHLVPQQAIFAVLLGVILHCTYIASRSLMIPMLIHFLWNAISILSNSTSCYLPLSKSLEETYARNGFLFLFTGGMVLATVGLAFYQSRFRRMSLDGRPVPSLVEIPLPGKDVILVREPIPPGTVVLIVMALGAFSSIWWNM